MNRQANDSAKSKEAHRNAKSNTQLHHICFCRSTPRAFYRQLIGLTTILFTVVIFTSCGGQNSNDTLEVEAYSSYNNTMLPSVVIITNQTSRYDSVINNSQELIGLPNTDIAIKTTNWIFHSNRPLKITQYRPLISNCHF